jgi:hypothetical protein
MKRAFFGILAAIGLTAGGCAGSTPVMELRGTLHLKGSVPHSFLVLEEERTHTNYKVANAKAMGLLRRQNHLIQVKAKLLQKAKGPGFPAVIKVIEVKR